MSPVAIPAAAAPITYTLSDATATFSQGTVDLSGTFMFDLSSETVIKPDITATGPIPPLPVSPDPFDFPEESVNPTEISLIDASGDAGITINFSPGLSAASSQLSQVTIINFSTGDGFGTQTVTGSAVPSQVTEPQVPEPSALALLGTALAGLFLFRFRANRRDRQLHDHHPETA